MPARLIKIKYITIRAEKVASPVTALHRGTLSVIGVGSPGHSSSVSGPQQRSKALSVDRSIGQSRLTEIRGLKNPEIWFFAKMVWKITSGSGFHFIFTAHAMLALQALY